MHGEFNDGCAPAGRHGRAHRHRPYPSPSYFSTQSHTNQIIIYAQSTQTEPTLPRAIPQTKPTIPRVIYPNEMRRGGACVPARTSAQRRFHAKNTRIVCGEFNDECALAGRRGRAHRHRPYQSPSYFATQSHTNKITIYMQSAQRKPTVHVQSAPTHLHQTARCVITPSGLYFR